MRQSLCPHAILARAPVSGDWLPLPSCRCLWASGACPVASACLTTAVSWRKQNVDTTRIPPGRVPSGRPINCTLACWVPLGPNKGCIGRLYAFAPGLPTRQFLCPPVIFARSWRNFSCSKRQHDVDATSTPPGREPPGRPIASTVPHLLIDSRPGPKSGVECRLTILLLWPHCRVFHSVRVPALSVGAGEGNLLAHQRRLEVPKLTETRSQMGSRFLLICGIHVSRDLLRELAIELFDMAKHYSCTCVPFVSFRYPRRV